MVVLKPFIPRPVETFQDEAKVLQTAGTEFAHKGKLIGLAQHVKGTVIEFRYRRRAIAVHIPHPHWISGIGQVGVGPVAVTARIIQNDPGGIQLAGDQAQIVHNGHRAGNLHPTQVASFVEDTPHHHRGVVTVAQHQFPHLTLLPFPQLWVVLHPADRRLLMKHQSHLICQFDKTLGRRFNVDAQHVQSSLLSQKDLLAGKLFGLRIGNGATVDALVEGTFHNDLLAVKVEEIIPHRKLPHPKTVGPLVQGLPVL